MPRKRKVQRQSPGQGLIETIESQGRNVLGLIEAEIHRLEGNIAQLRQQAERWATALGAVRSGALSRVVGGAPARRGRPPKRASAAPHGARPRPAKKRTSPPVDWNRVLDRLPKRFTLADVAKATPKLAKTPQARVIAVARWARSKHIRKVGPGQYQKT